MAFIVTIAREGAHQINLTPEESPAQLECPKDPGLYGLFSGIRGHSGGPAGRQTAIRQIRAQVCNRRMCIAADQPEAGTIGRPSDPHGSDALHARFPGSQIIRIFSGDVRVTPIVCILLPCMISPYNIDGNGRQVPGDIATAIKAQSRTGTDDLNTKGTSRSCRKHRCC